MPLIDALIRELNMSGYLRDQGYEILTTYFTRDLGLDWRFGASHFEEKMIDFVKHENDCEWIFSFLKGKTHPLAFKTERME